MVEFIKRKKGLLITILIGVAAAVLVIAYESSLLEWNRTNVLRMVSDGLFVPGIFLSCAGLMTMIATAGAFDGFSYLMQSLVWNFSPRTHKFKDRKSYLDYKKEKQKKRSEEERSPRYILITGVCFLLLSFVIAVI
jgi:hypothetical protein